MNGELTVNSTPGEGSIFEFTTTLGRVPESKCTETSCCPKPAQRLVLEHDKLRGARVILVDAHPVRQVFSNIHALTDLGGRSSFAKRLLMDSLIT
jgi:histidine kinase 2/3/4 (cytokinin receptor)